MTEIRPLKIADVFQAKDADNYSHDEKMILKQRVLFAAEWLKQSIDRRKLSILHKRKLFEQIDEAFGEVKKE